jgi:hypothetical protein
VTVKNFLLTGAILLEYLFTGMQGSHRVPRTSVGILDVKTSGTESGRIAGKQTAPTILFQESVVQRSLFPNTAGALRGMCEKFVANPGRRQRLHSVFSPEYRVTRVCEQTASERKTVLAKVRLTETP